MDIKALYAVTVVAERGSFAEAALELGVSLSTISLQISALERELDKTLFDRRTRPPTITSNGRSFIKSARQLLTQWEELQGSDPRSGARSAMKIGAVHTVVTHTLPSVLLELQKEAPEITVRLVTGLTNELMDSVSRHHLDCAIVTIPENLPSELVCFEISSEPLVVISHPSAKGKTVKALLESNPYVKFSPDAQVAKIVEILLANRKFKVNSRMEIDTLDAVVSLVKHGLGVSIIPHAQIPGTLPTDLKITHFAKPIVTRKIGLITHRESQDNEAVSRLLRIFRSLVI